MKSRFELDQSEAAQTSREPIVYQSIHAGLTARRYVDPESIETESHEADSRESESYEPESYDASENGFAISLEKSFEDSPRFLIEERHRDRDNVSDAPHNGFESASIAAEEYADGRKEVAAIPDFAQRESFKLSSKPISQPESKPGIPWRQEVSARLTRYQARRRIREPRYPSLQLNFETQKAWQGPSPEIELSSGVVPNTLARAQSTLSTNAAPDEIPFRHLEPASRIIEFPRSSAVPPSHSEELAEPVFDRPRIMEAPELVPVAPALGGILIEPAEEPASEKRPGFEMPLQAASMERRLGATVIDGLIVFAGLALFGYIFWRVAGSTPSARAAVTMLAIVGITLWTIYQYLLIVHCGTTPGLKLAKLKLSHFDGSAVPQKKRRWRVLASMLSALSLGLGYAWCFLDEDRLCWHDRITRTYMSPAASASK